MNYIIELIQIFKTTLSTVINTKNLNTYVTDKEGSGRDSEFDPKSGS